MLVCDAAQSANTAVLFTGVKTVGITDQLTTCEFVVVCGTVPEVSYVGSDVIDSECDIGLSHLGEHDGLVTVTCGHVSQCV